VIEVDLRLLTVIGLICLMISYGFLTSSHFQEEEARFSHRDLAQHYSTFVNIDGIDVHVRFDPGNGKKTGLSFVLLHGFASWVYTWDHVFDELAEMGSVLAYDRPGFGLTEKVLPKSLGFNPYTQDYQMKLLTELLDYHSLDSVILMGHSAGGVVALRYALEHPERVRALVLIDPAVYIQPPFPEILNRVLTALEVEELGPRFFAERFIDFANEGMKLSWYDASKITPERVEKFLLPTRIKNWEIALWKFMKANLDQRDLEERLSLLTIPTLIIWGKQDRIVPLEDGKRLLKTLSNATLVTINRCGHVPQEEAPHAFLQIIKEWTDQLNARHERIS